MPRPDEKEVAGKRRFKGLPPLEEPFVKPGHRVLLMACSKTGRASWVDLAPLAKHEGGFRWVGHIPAVPDFAAIKGGTNAGSGRGTPGDSGESTLSDGSIYWGNYRCGVCDCGSTPVPGHERSLFWQCSSCRVLYCSGGFERAGEDAWYLTCPGCGRLSVLKAHEETWTISEYEASAGREEGSNARRLEAGNANEPKRLSGGTGDARGLPNHRRK